MTIWFETDDLLAHFDWDLHPTGIQRVALAIIGEALAQRRDSVGVCRLSRHSGRLSPLDASAFWAQCAEPPPYCRATPLRIARFLARHGTRRIGDHVRGVADERALAARLAPGDVLVCLGLPWRNPDYGRQVAAAKRRYGLRFALLIHDVLPLSDPRYFAPGFVAAFARWFDAALPVCDTVLVGSSHVADAVRASCRARGFSPPAIARVVFGAGVGAAGKPAALQREVRDPFVLCVSTFGGRKNHALLLRVWRRLLDTHGPDRIPALVLVGTGGQRAAIADGIERAKLGGKIVIAPAVGDSELRELYRRCLFTVYPSLSEGWGLPIAESLMHGRFCVASNAASLPEVGGDLVDYFDPENDDDAADKIGRAVFDRDYLASRSARVAAEYRAPSWRDCADAVLRAVETPSAGVEKSVGSLA
ncbi:MAG TPA: glycosyltransferase [Stellaceae bacterium]|nr:glycosyltransferase [Stellaceae bacterium]